MTSGYPTEATTDAVQENIVAARYEVPRLSVSRVSTFTPRSSQTVTVTFANTTGSPVFDVRLSAVTPAGWTAQATVAATFAGPVAPGATVSTGFRITSPAKTGAGHLMARSEWKASSAGRVEFDTVPERVRNVFAVKINEVGLGNSLEPTDQFIELYNASSGSVDISNWTLVNTPSQWAPVRLAAIPPATKLAPGAFYLLGLSGSGLAAPAEPGATTIHVRSTNGFSTGAAIDVGGEFRTIKIVGTAAAVATPVFEPVSTGPWITIPAGSTNLPVT